MSLFFISYAHKDATEIARSLKSRMLAAGLVPILDEDDIPPGEDWSPGIEAAIESSICVIVIVTEKALQSHHVTKEWAYALGKGKKLLPLLIESRLADEYSTHPLIKRQCKNFTKIDEDAWSSLIEHLREVKSNLDVDPIVADAERTLNLTDDSKWNGAVYVLERFQHESATDALVRLVNSNNPDVSLKCAFALNRRTKYKDVRSIPAFMRVMQGKTSTSDDFVHVITDLVSMDCSEATACLAEGLTTFKHDDHFRNEIQKRVTPISDPSVVPLLLELMRERRGTFPLNIVSRLAEFRDPSTYPDFLELLRGSPENSGLRLTAIRAINTFAFPEAIELLLETLLAYKQFLYTHEVNEGGAIIEALGNIKDGLGLDSLLGISRNNHFRPLNQIIRRAIENAKQNIPVAESGE